MTDQEQTGPVPSEGYFSKLLHENRQLREQLAAHELSRYNFFEGLKKLTVEESRQQGVFPCYLNEEEQLAQAQADRDMAVLHMREPDDAGPHPTVDTAIPFRLDGPADPMYDSPTLATGPDEEVVFTIPKGQFVRMRWYAGREDITGSAIRDGPCKILCQPVKETPASKDTELTEQEQKSINKLLDDSPKKLYSHDEVFSGKGTNPEPDPIREV